MLPIASASTSGSVRRILLGICFLAFSWPIFHFEARSAIGEVIPSPFRDIGFALSTILPIHHTYL